MSKRPAARAAEPEMSPEAKSLRADAQNPRPEPRVVFNKDAPSPHAGKRGGRRMGRNEIDPDSIPWDRSDPKPDLGQRPIVFALVVEHARDGSAWRFRVGQVIDERTMKPVELDERFDSGVIRGHHGGVSMHEALQAAGDIVLERMGVPGLLERLE